MTRPLGPAVRQAVTAPTDEAGEIRSAVAANLRRLRLRRGLSLREMAAETGLSKALLSQIERQVANPTVAALSRIATALDVTFAELTRTVCAAPEVIRGADRDPSRSGARMLFQLMERRRFDLSEGVLVPGQAGVLSDHGRGSIEYGYVVSGMVVLTVQVAGELEELRLDAGDAVRFGSEVRHVYAALGGPATLVTIVAYGDE